MKMLDYACNSKILANKSVEMLKKKEYALKNTSIRKFNMSLQMYSQHEDLHKVLCALFQLFSLLVMLMPGTVA